MNAYVFIEERPTLRLGRDSLLSDWRDNDWTPWINVTDDCRPEIPALAVRKYIRDRGGLSAGERLTIQCYYFFALEMERPKSLHVTTFKASNNSQQ